MLTIKQAAEYADKSESWIRKKILSGELAAEKKAFKYGKRWETTKAAVDDLLKQAKVDREVVEVREVNEPVPAETLINRILEASEEQNKALIEKATDSITDKIEAQNEQLERQQQLIKDLSDKLEELNQRQNKTLFDKVKEFFYK